MRIAVGSIFRNSTSYLDRYFTQIEEMRSVFDPKGIGLSLYLVEGDSSDNTWNSLAKYFIDGDFDGKLIKRQHGGPAWGSVDVPERWKALSWCSNGTITQVTDEDAFIYVESDLVWSAATMIELLEDVLERGLDAVAPMSMTPSNRFYDIWGHVKDGVQFDPYRPYHPALNGERFVTLDSAGSCIVMSNRVARVARFGPLDCVRGLGKSIREHGFSLWLDSHQRVYHP